jgi:dipeptidyl aminopeptidase/acylaminoacyl peptidase
MRLRLLLLLTLCFFPIPVFPEKRAFTLEDLYRIKTPSDVQVSPDGKSLLYAVTTRDLPRSKSSTHLWMMDTDGRNARQITHSEKGEASPLFSPDGQWISFISSRDGKPNLYIMPVHGGEARRLTNISTGIADPLWSPNSQFLVFSSNVYPQCSGDEACNKKTAEQWSKGPLKAHLADQLLYRHWDAWKDGTRTHVLLVGVANGEIRDLTPENFDAPPFQLGGPRQYDVAPDGSALVYVSNHDQDLASSTNNDLWSVSLADKNAVPRNLTVSNPAFDGNPKYSPDGRHIAYRLQKQPGYESDLFRLAVYELATGTTSILTESFRNWVEDFEWSDDSKAIYFCGPLEGHTPLYRVDLDNKRITPVLEGVTLDGFKFAPGEKRLVYIQHSTGQPREIYAAEMQGWKAGPPTCLTTLNDAVAGEVDIRPAESVWVGGAGGARIQTFIVKPHDFNPQQKYPLILNVHGGPQQQWSDSFRGDWQVYPGAGYVVAFANPHGSTGYGQDFTAEISGDWGGQVFEDLMKVTDYLEKLPYVDSARMGAMGWSYGGYMMNWFEGHTNRFKAIASMMGVYDLRSMFGATEELWFPKWEMKGQPWNSPLYEKWSPSNYVQNFKMPALVISGERDHRVPYTQSLQFFTALQEMKVPSRLIIYSDAGHWPSWYEMALYYTVHLEWFHQYLGGSLPPWSTEQFQRNAVFDQETGKRVAGD